MSNAGDCCFEPVCKKFPGVTPCGRCEWTCTPCGVLFMMLSGGIGIICCCTPDCEICGCHCNKTVKRDLEPARRRYLFGVIPMGDQKVHTSDRQPWYAKRFGLF